MGFKRRMGSIKAGVLSMFGDKHNSTFETKPILDKLKLILEYMEDIQETLEKLDERVTKIEASINNKTEVDSLKDEIRHKSKFMEELLMKLITERPREVITQPYNNRYSGNGYKSNNPSIAGPVGKLP